MPHDGYETPAFCFGEFELEPLKSELRRCGVRVKLQHQPYNVLALLVQRQGQLVTRDEIQRHLWGDDTFVDFEKGINFCLRQIRAALGDDAREPRYIETIRSQGYRFLKSKLLPLRVDHLASSPKIGREAYQLYVTGRYFWTKRTEEALRKAISYFERAIAGSPTYALAYSALADCYLICSLSGIVPPRDAYPKAKAAVERALELDYTLSEAHASLGYFKMTAEWQWQTAELEFQKAIELNPSCSTARQWYADYLTAVGRHNDAVHQMKRAWELDPLSININADVGWALTYARRYDEAIEHYHGLVEMEPNFVKARWGLALACLQKSRFQEAVQELRKAVCLNPGNPMVLAALGYAHALSGEKTQAQKLLEKLRSVASRRYVPAYEMAIFHLGLGDRRRSCACLQQAYSERSAYLVYLATDPRFAALRSGKDFSSVTGRLGLAS